MANEAYCRPPDVAGHAVPVPLPVPAALGRKAIRHEASGLLMLANSIGATFDRVVERVLACRGRLVVVGMGKSGHVARKIAATFASTGTPSMFVHPAEAGHGDLGMIERRDLVLALSKSGESPELSHVLVYCRRFGIPVVSITARASSTLAGASTEVLLLPDIEEACPLGLAPTTSTTMSLALGDALAIACVSMRDFKPEQFRDFHPLGALGQKLTRVRDVMHSGIRLPLVDHHADVAAALDEMSRERFGCVGIIDPDGKLAGIFTDGDLRRGFAGLAATQGIAKVMHAAPQAVEPDTLLADVVKLFTEKRIPSVFVCVEGRPVGIVHVHDLLQKGFI